MIVETLLILSLKSIKKHEGYRCEPYLDTEGILTIGIGRNLEAHPLENRDYRKIREYCESHGEKAGFENWHEDFAKEKIKQDLSKLRTHLEFFDDLTTNRQVVLLDMVYNLGDKLFDFKKMLKAMREGDYLEASKQIDNSKFAKQTGRRAVTLSKMMREG